MHVVKRTVVTACFFLVLGVEAFAEPRGKNEESYRPQVSPSEEPRPRGKKIAGILVTSIGGGIGVATVGIGALMNTCAGSYGDNKVECRKNAQDTINAGAILTVISAAVGVPLIVVGVSE